VEHILAKYTWAKEAQKKIEKLKEEGKPLPKSFNEVTLGSLTTIPSHIILVWYDMQNAIGLLRIVVPFDFIMALFGRLFFWLINRLWLICCERKTLFHG
jgi:hypothetical protein